MEVSDEEAVDLIYQFLQLLDWPECRYWVHPINGERNIAAFTNELQQDPDKFLNYCRMCFHF